MLTRDSSEIYLIVEAEGGIDGHGPRLFLNGRDWTVKLFSISQNSSEKLLDYVCVSYIWGADRTENPMDVGPQDISTNTLPALSAAMQNTDTKAFWIDAFCVPSVQPAKTATLESMGYIYRQAKEVRIVLSETSFLAVKQSQIVDRLSDEALVTLEADKWTRSVWTYQEVINCQRFAFVCPSAPGLIIDGTRFLNGLGYSISQYKKEHDIDGFLFRKTFPSLDALEDLIGDWMVAPYEKPSALAVMSNMDRREWSEERNYFYSMIGAIASEPCRRLDTEQQHLAETFMRICESRGDFSFVYTSSPRSRDPTRRWRPRAGTLPSILPWHCWGESQRGHFDGSGSFWLDQVLILQRSPLSGQAKDHISRWLHREDFNKACEDELGEHIYSALVDMGFTGVKTFVTLTDGMFFPQLPESAEGAVIVDVVVSGTIRWTVGAPGIASCVDKNGAACFIPGVFAGIVNDKMATSVKLI